MTAKRTSRVMGLLLVVQLAGLIVPFVLLLPLGRDVLTTAAPAAGPIRTALIALFINGGLTMRVDGVRPDHGGAAFRGDPPSECSRVCASGHLGMPMALGHLALATWLLARGVPNVDPQPMNAEMPA